MDIKVPSTSSRSSTSRSFSRNRHATLTTVMGLSMATLFFMPGCIVLDAAGLAVNVAKLGVETATAGVKITGGVAKLTLDAAGAVITGGDNDHDPKDVDTEMAAVEAD